MTERGSAVGTPVKDFGRFCTNPHNEISRNILTSSFNACTAILPRKHQHLKLGCSIIYCKNTAYKHPLSYVHGILNFIGSMTRRVPVKAGYRVLSMYGLSCIVRVQNTHSLRPKNAYIYLLIRAATESSMTTPHQRVALDISKASSDSQIHLLFTYTSE